MMYQFLFNVIVTLFCVWVCVWFISDTMDDFVMQCRTSIKEALVTYKYVLNETEENGAGDLHADVLTLMTEVRPFIHDAILTKLVRLWNIKWHIACKIRFIKSFVDGDGVKTRVTKDTIFHACCCMLLPDDNDEHNQIIDKSYEKIFNSISKFTRDGSGWTLDTGH